MKMGRVFPVLGSLLAFCAVMAVSCSSGATPTTLDSTVSTPASMTTSSSSVPDSPGAATTSTSLEGGESEAVLFPVRYNEKWGYIDLNGVVVVEPQFDEAYAFSDGLGRIGVDQDTVGMFGFIDATGAIVITPQFSWASDFSEGLSMARATAGGKSGYIDKGGTWVVEPQFINAGEFHDGLAPVQLTADDLVGYIDTTGANAIAPLSREALPFSDGLAVVAAPQDLGTRDMFGYVDETGTWAIEPRFYDASSFSEGLALVSFPAKGGEEAGYIDKAGNVVFALQVPQAEPRSSADFSFSEGLAAWVGGDGRWGFIDKTGGFAIAPELDQVTAFCDGLAAVCVTLNKDTWGYIDNRGAWVIEPQFRLARPFSHGLAAVVIGDKSAYIDRTGKVVWKAP